jgi:atypical dual specificity phosphatase
MDTWWIDSPCILGSANPSTATLEQLRREGFEVLVSLLREEEQAPKYDLILTKEMGFVRRNIPVKDFNPPTVDQLLEFIRLVKDLAPGTKVIIHCQAGIGRTGTFAAAYWISKGMSGPDAIAFVRRVRWHAIETSAQEAILERFARKIHKLP